MLIIQRIQNYNIFKFIGLLTYLLIPIINGLDGMGRSDQPHELHSLTSNDFPRRSKAQYKLDNQKYNHQRANDRVDRKQYWLDIR